MKRRIKVIHITHSVDHGGAEIMMSELLTGLNPKRFKPAICSFRTGGSLRNMIEARGIPVFDVVQNPNKDLGLLFRLYRFFRTQKPDVIHAHNGYMWLYSILPAKMAGARVVYTEHSVWENPTPLYLIGSKIMEKITDQIVTPSYYVKRLMSSRQRIDKKNVQVIYNGINLKRIDKQINVGAKKKELGLNRQMKVIGIIARLVPVKNHAALIDAMKIICRQMDNCHLLIVGDGELRQDLENQVHLLGLDGRISFLGNREDVPEILQILDLFVLCSKSEGFPISVLEAMAAKVPILATSVGGIPEALAYGMAGKLIPYHDPSSIARGILELLTCPKEAARLKEYALKRVRTDFSLDVMTRNYTRIYQDLIK